MVDLLAGITPTTGYDSFGVSCSSWTPAVGFPERSTDTDDDTKSTRASSVKQSNCTYQTIWTYDLGADELAGAYRIVKSHIGEWALEYADAPGGPWTEAAAFDATTGGVDIGTSQWEHTGTFDDVIEARYWRAVHSQPPWGSGGVGFMQGVELFTFELTEGDAPPEPEPPGDPGDWVPPEPGRAIVEIYVADPDGAKWGIAEWGVDSWAASAWEPIDYLVTGADVTRGTDDGSQGILADPRAASWSVRTHDPDRDLDPANASSPFAGQIVPGLPIRIRHRSTVLRQARVTRPEYSLALRGGVIRAADAIADLAGTKIPPDSDLADTLYARARDAIAAAGLAVTVLPDPPEGDPAVPAYTPGDARTPWEAILTAAQGVLWVPYIDRTNQLGFRSWVAGLERGRSLSSPELMDVTSWMDHDGLYSGVRVLDDATDLVIDRAITPTPAYGKRVYDARQDVPTLDAEAWADTVLADRADVRPRYRPGQVRPLDADSVETHGTMELLEGVDLLVPEADPPVAVHVRILGDRLEVTDETRRPDQVRSRWRFTYTTTQAPPLMLAEDGDPATLLVDDATGDLILVTG